MCVIKASGFLYSLHFQKYPTLTLWSTCGRTYGKGYHEWDGVVCLGHQENEEKVLS